MSFSSDVKKELCAVLSCDREVLRAELYGMLLFCKYFSQNKIVFTTENSYASKRIVMLLQNLYMPIIEKQTALRTRSDDSHLYKIIVVDENDCKKIYDDYGHTENQITLRVNRANLSSDDLVAPFLRGVFLSCGSVTNPIKSYHAELCVPHKNLSVDLCKIISEITDCTLTPKTVIRNGNYIVYFKESEQICDLLTYIGAPIKAMEIMGTKAIKQVRNNVNRRTNGEIANIGKVAAASAKQLEAINYIKQTTGLDTLPDDLKEIAYLRLENPEMSLRDLGQNLSVPISRSGANHRMQRLLEYVQTEDK